LEDRSFASHESIDLLESPSFESEITPNLAVIQELEEIRDMIECKSRDLYKQEAFLNQSMDQLKFTHAQTVAEIRNHYEGLLEEASVKIEKRLAEKVKRASALLERVTCWRPRNFELQWLANASRTHNHVSPISRRFQSIAMSQTSH